MTPFKGAALAGVSLALGACTGILDIQDPAAVNEAAVWNDPALAEAYVDRMYADNLPGWSTGDATTSDESPGGTDQLYGQMTVSSVDYWPYGPIRRINILLADIDHGTIDTVTIRRMKGEAYFFRAWRYWEMVKRYGGVPLVLVPQKLTDSLLAPRNSTSQCMAQILSDLAQAIARRSCGLIVAKYTIDKISPTAQNSSPTACRAIHSVLFCPALCHAASTGSLELRPCSHGAVEPRRRVPGSARASRFSA